MTARFWLVGVACVFVACGSNGGTDSGASARVTAPVTQAPCSILIQDSGGDIVRVTGTRGSTETVGSVTVVFSPRCDTTTITGGEALDEATAELRVAQGKARYRGD